MLPTRPDAPETARSIAAATAGARLSARVLVILLLLGAVYLIAVRHEAIIADLSALAAWCL
jgi:hypothetical protein